MIELNLYFFLIILESLAALVLLAGFLYWRVKKYKPFFDLKENPQLFLQTYFKNNIKATKTFASSLNNAAEEGNEKAKQHRQSMVARLNWLQLEHDFIKQTTPNNKFWKKISKRIHSVLERWQLDGLIKKLPDDEAINAILTPPPPTTTNDPFELDVAFPEDETDVLEISKTDVDLLSIKNHLEEDPENTEELKKRIIQLEKKVRNLSSYKALFLGLQSNYNELLTANKTLKQKLFALGFNDANADDLTALLSEHEQHQQNLETKMNSLEGDKERLKDELEQLEAAYQLQLESTAHINHHQESADDEDLINVQNIIDNQDITIRELKATLLHLNLEQDAHDNFDRISKEFEKNNREISTCMQMLEMERERLQNEMGVLHSQ